MCIYLWQSNIIKWISVFPTGWSNSVCMSIWFYPIDAYVLSSYEGYSNTFWMPSCSTQYLWGDILTLFLATQCHTKWLEQFQWTLKTIPGAPWEEFPQDRLQDCNRDVFWRPLHKSQYFSSLSSWTMNSWLLHHRISVMDFNVAFSVLEGSNFAGLSLFKPVSPPQTMACRQCIFHMTFQHCSWPQEIKS